jgi:peptide/nickel transport system substrate-binding protein
VTSDFWVNMAFNFGGQGPAAKPLPALQDLQVRKAIEMAIDKQKIVDTVYPGAASPGETIIRPLSVYWHLDVPDDKQIPYDPAAANAMLDAAGYAGSRRRRVTEDRQPLKIRMPVSDDTAGSTPVGRTVAGFPAISITVTVRPVTAGKMYDLQQAGDFDAHLLSSDPDPNYQLSVFTSSACRTSATAAGRTRHTTRSSRRAGHPRPGRAAADRQEMQQYVCDQVPNIVIAYRTRSRPTAPTRSPGSRRRRRGRLLPSYAYTGMVTRSRSRRAPTSRRHRRIPPWVWIAVLAVVARAGVTLRRRGGRRRRGRDRLRA